MNPVDQQLTAYNNRDLDSFLPCYSDAIQVFLLESNQLLTQGKEQLRQSMTDSFAANPHAQIFLVSRIYQDNLIIDLEKITNYADGQTITTLAIYEVQDSKITKLWFGGRTVD